MIDTREITEIPTAPKQFAPDWVAILKRGVEGMPEDKKDLRPDFNEIIKRGVILAESSPEKVGAGDLERMSRLVQYGLDIEKNIKSTRDQLEELESEISKLAKHVPAVNVFEKGQPENGVYLQLRGGDDLSADQRRLMALRVEREKLIEQLLRGQEEMKRWKATKAPSMAGQ